MSDPNIGKEVEGYRIEKVLGQGGMGVVYQAEDIALSRTVAVKRINPSLAEDEAFLRRFRSEARTLARIDSNYIVSVYALRRTDLGLLLVMEYVGGGDLLSRIRTGPLDWQEAMPIISQMLKAMEHAHTAEVIHRDVKPHNIMLTEDDTVKVTDFGLAKVHEPDADKTVTEGVFGTLNYMSPEQVQGKSDLDPRSDLYSVGMTIYEMLTWQLPFDKDASEFEKMRAIVEEEFDPPHAVRSEVPEQLSQLIMKSLAKDPDDRFQDARTMREAFEAFAARHRSGGTGGSGARAAGTETSSSRSWGTMAGAAALVVVLLAGAYGLYAAFSGGGTDAASSAQSGDSASGGPAPATVRVSTTPTGASVYLDDKLVGVTPLDESIDGDTARLQVQKKGYVPVDTTLALVAGRTEQLDVRLAPKPTTVTLASEPSGATVYANGEALGRTPLDHTFTTPTAQLRLRKSGYTSVDTTIDVGPTTPSQIDVQLPARRVARQTPSPDRSGASSSAGGQAETTARSEPQPTGTLTLNAAPEGTVLVDGDEAASGSSVQVTAGTHEVRFRHPEYGTKDTTLTVKADDTVDLTCYFQHRVVVQANPVWASVTLDGEDTGEYTAHSMQLGPGTHRIGARVAEQRGTVSGGTYRRKYGDDILEPQTFSGAAKTIQLAPSFQKQTHILDFTVDQSDSSRR